MISGGEIASYLAIAMGIVYLIVELRSKRLAQRDKISMIFTIEVGAYLIIVGILALLLRQGRIDAGLYAPVIWVFALTLLLMFIYIMEKKGTKGGPT
ncbi:hypothetical protein CL1_0247 [Thermococcus cleftensis]|uniref:Uncharacterized protein n=1 Tax=Thermococcus cleftensis (strain DSM 27260 / KACC 17922 / CL1) TaxID=163003 RepID=I3ZRX5_THECF|nr:hypothetical protein [Thermococcus cleftensis]AFL94459.1 hypothetical protein CL1_0247 [Thermococcus cleftensis]